MGVTVKIPAQLRTVTGGESEAVVDDATTVGEVQILPAVAGG